MELKPGQRDIINALRHFGGKGTPRLIAEVTNKRPDGVAKSLKAMPASLVRKGQGENNSELDRTWFLRS